MAISKLFQGAAGLKSVYDKIIHPQDNRSVNVVLVHLLAFGACVSGVGHETHSLWRWENIKGEITQRNESMLDKAGTNLSQTFIPSAACRGTALYPKYKMHCTVHPTSTAPHSTSNSYHQGQAQCKFIITATHAMMYCRHTYLGTVKFFVFANNQVKPCSRRQLGSAPRVATFLAPIKFQRLLAQSYLPASVN